MNRFLRIGAAMGALALVSACASITEHRGYIVDETLLQAVQPGLDNQTSVEQTLGHPTFTSQFGQPTWYYVSSVTEQAPFGRPQIENHTVLAVTFDEAGNVVSTERSGVDQVARVSPNGDETPTLGRERGFLEDLFGNIGTVGMPGAGAPPGQ